MALIDCKDVCLGYEGKVILQGVNFQLNGENICLLLVRTEPVKVHLQKDFLN